MEKEKQSAETVRPLTDDELSAVNGGMKIIVHKNNKFMKKILDLIYRIKKKKH